MRGISRRPLLVIGVWIVVAGILNIAVPQIHTVAATRSADFIPRDAPAVEALQNMGVKFQESTSSGTAYVVLHDQRGLDDADHAFYTSLVERLRQDSSHVQSVQDLWNDKAAAAAALSPDRTTVYALVRLTGDTGTSASVKSVAAVRDIANGGSRPAGLSVATTGPAATVSDEFAGIEKSLPAVTALTVVCILVVLLLVYRSLAAVVIPLATIGIALAAANGACAALGVAGMPLSIFSVSLLSAIVLGAGTDYAIFLVSRYHEARRTGMSTESALEHGYARIAPVILASGLVVALTSAGMSVAKIGLFRTVGLPCAIGVLITLLAALTFTPASMKVAVWLGMLEPRRTGRRTRYWRWLAVTTVRHPRRAAALSLGLMILLAASIPTIHLSYDERKAQDADSESNRGYQLVSQHFRGNTLLPQYVTISSDRDLRTTGAFAAMEKVAQSISVLPDVVSVQAISRPFGTTIPESSLGYQAGVVADGLSGGVREIAAAQPQLNRLDDGGSQVANGAGALSSGLQRLDDGTGQARNGSQQLVDGNQRLADGLSAARDGSSRIRDGASQLADGSKELSDRVASATDFLTGPAAQLAALRAQVAANPDCARQPICATARTLLAALDATGAPSLLDQVTQLRQGTQRLADGNAELLDGATQLDNGLDAASAGSQALLAGQRQLDDGLGQLKDGTGLALQGGQRLADGTQQLDGGVHLATSQIIRIRDGLKTAADYLAELRANTQAGANGGFYIPQFAMSRPDLQTAIKLFISPDGRMARLIVTDTGDPFSTDAMRRSQVVLDTARRALGQTELRNSTVDVTGLTPVYRDLRDMSLKDFTDIIIVACILSFLIIALLVRSLVIPVYIVGSAIVSFLAALGLSVLIWQHILHQPLHWAVPPLAFIILVAVGSDYNVLLMSRVRDEARDSPGGLRGSPDLAIVRAVTSTGGVITTAGAVFAIAMLALTAAATGNTAQVGFTIGIGLLLDTLIVRTVTVPAVAAMVGRRNWWWPFTRRAVPDGGPPASEQPPGAPDRT
ncbi:MMPL/RND family transporter [Williamsia sterculiae]|nr:RND family transporter [Williamsia sterculiae]